MSDSKTGLKPVWLTALIVTFTNTIIWGILRLIERNVNGQAYTEAGKYFAPIQADSFPLIYLAVMFIVMLIVVLAYRQILPSLPPGWIVRGLMVGGFLFLAGDLPNTMLNAYLTSIPGSISWGAGIAALFNQLINGCILVNLYRRFSASPAPAPAAAARR